jgi:carboxyl-terminal processing protease
LFALPLLMADMSSAERNIQLDSFEHVWQTIRDKHWEERPGGLDWQKVHDELRPKAEKAKEASEIRALMADMLARLKQSHFKVITATDYQDMDLEASWGVGEAGFDARVIGDSAYVVQVDPQVPVNLGWKIRKIRGRELTKSIQAVDSVYKNTTYRELRMTSMLHSKLTGAPGTGMPIEFEDAQGNVVNKTILLKQPRGNPAAFGNLPPVPVWIDARKIATNTGYIRFNMFLDPVRIAGRISSFLTTECQQCDGMVIDVRGNPGGIGIMATGIAGWFVSKPNTKLGTMYMRDSQLKFVVNPRPQTFNGPVAILIDGASASTAEIFAGGMQDLKRARIFGTRSAAAALPSIVERLPSGDGFQYAVANYISDGGKALEGNGVVPDEEVPLTREGLLRGKDPVVEAALAWIRKQPVAQQQKKGIQTK